MASILRVKDGSTGRWIEVPAVRGSGTLDAARALKSSDGVVNVEVESGDKLKVSGTTAQSVPYSYTIDLAKIEHSLAYTAAIDQLDGEEAEPFLKRCVCIVSEQGTLNAGSQYEIDVQAGDAVVYDQMAWHKIGGGSGNGSTRLLNDAGTRYIDGDGRITSFLDGTVIDVDVTVGGADFSFSAHRSSANVPGESVPDHDVRFKGDLSDQGVDCYLLFNSGTRRWTLYLWDTVSASLYVQASTDVISDNPYSLSGYPSLFVNSLLELSANVEVTLGGALSTEAGRVVSTDPLSPANLPFYVRKNGTTYSVDIDGNGFLKATQA